MTSLPIFGGKNVATDKENHCAPFPGGITLVSTRFKRFSPVKPLVRPLFSLVQLIRSVPIIKKWTRMGQYLNNSLQIVCELSTPVLEEVVPL